jgi:hypothetical protein
VGGEPQVLAGPAVKHLRFVVLGVLVLAAAGLVAALVLGTTDKPRTARSLDRGQLLAASANLAPASHLFAGPIHVRVDAIVDRSRIDPNRVYVESHWSPYEVVGGLLRRRKDVGAVTRLTWTGDIHCVVIACTPAPGSAVLKQLRPTYVRYRQRPGDRAVPSAVKISWPSLNGFSRLDPNQLQRTALVSKVGRVNRLSVVLPPWRLDSLPIGSDSYRITPTTLFWLSLCFAAGLLAAAFLLARPWLPALHFGRRAPPPSRLERALLTVEQARARPDERRKALELLAEELRSSGRGGLAGEAKELAWAQHGPEGDRTAALTAQVRRDLERRSNGHRV